MSDQFLKNPDRALKLSGRLFILNLLLLFMFIMMKAGTSLAQEVSPCPAGVNMVPIQIMGQIKPSSVTTLSDAKILDFPPGFLYFVTSVTEHVAAKLAQEKLCLDSAENRERSLLQFVLMPVSIMETYPLVSEPQLEAQPTAVCRISSPWIDMVIEPGPIPQVRAIVRYNERQLLADQAMLSGEQGVPTGVAKRLAASEYNQYATEYSRWWGSSSQTWIAERVPSDLLWLFRRTAPGLVPFRNSATGTKIQVMEKGAEGYTKIVIALIDRCFESGGAAIHCDSILDVADLIQIDEYKIDMPIKLPNRHGDSVNLECLKGDKS